MWMTLVALSCIAAGPCLGGLAQNRFTVQFFKDNYRPHENAVYAPIGIHSILTMLYHVAKPSAADYMQRHLFLPKNTSEATEEMKHLLSDVNQHRNTLELLTRVYLPDEPLDLAFIPHLRDNYNFTFEIINFFEKQNVIERVNMWVNESTRGVIPTFFTSIDLRSLKHLLFVNVMFSNSSWDFFNEKDTNKQIFHFVNGDYEVDMMQAEGNFPNTYLSDLMIDVIKLPYQHETDLSMLIILPVNYSSLGGVVHHFTTDHYQKLAELDNEDECYESIQLRMPRFKIQQKLNARSTWQSMQVGSLFSHQAFKILKKELSQLGQINQSIFVTVNENGNNAVARTGTRSEKNPAAMEIAVDRPFIFMIRKESTKDILIIGHYSKFER